MAGGTLACGSPVLPARAGVEGAEGKGGGNTGALPVGGTLACGAVVPARAGVEGAEVNENGAALLLEPNGLLLLLLLLLLLFVDG